MAKATLCLIISVLLIFITGVLSDDVSGIITNSVFNTFLYRSNDASVDCDSHGFYTYDVFMQAARSFKGFGATAAELAAFFANVAHETGSGCSVNEHANEAAQFGRYYGRGPLQLTGISNYQAAGDYLSQPDLGNNPDLLSTDRVLSFKASLWFWMTQGPHDAMVNNGQGFGGTIHAINSGECVSGDGQMQHRVNLYQSFCRTLGIDPGSNLYC